MYIVQIITKYKISPVSTKFYQAQSHVTQKLGQIAEIRLERI